MSNVSEYFNNAKKLAVNSNEKSLISELHAIANQIKRGGMSESIADQRFRSCLLNHGYSPSDLDLAKLEADRIKGFAMPEMWNGSVQKKAKTNSGVFGGMNENALMAGLGMGYRKTANKTIGKKKKTVFDLGNELGFNPPKNIGKPIDLEKELGFNGQVSKMGFPLHETKTDRRLNAVDVDKLLGISSGLPKGYKESENIFALKKQKKVPKDLMKKILWG